MVHQHFLQSSAWKAFQESQGLRTENLNFDGFHALGVHEKGMGKTGRLYVPYGPSAQTEDEFKKGLVLLEKAARDAGDVFVRIEPSSSAGFSRETLAALLEQHGYSKVHHVQPEDTWIADISCGKDEILANMKNDNRRSYKQAGKKNIEIISSEDPADIHYLTDLMALVATRNDVHLREAEYIAEQVKILFPLHAARLYYARTTTSVDDEPIEPTVIAASLAYINKDTMYYAHAGSDYAWKNKRANVALLVQMMIDASQRGLKYFDFYGIAPEDAPSDHPWMGFTRFKKSFGGQRVTYVGAWEKPVRPMRYFMYNAARKVFAR
ncbi:MAG: peptidoglycan bridge formation glycyltransferase FemA/FemB family protein [Actinomycetaceae bacterium]|nr:peptidoglycan bridge formation glycyltransferase FemA/FemB family protein [Actinomycetaceae bacterium]